MSRRRRRRRGGDHGLSFFSFQDIITSVTGILLLITLIMAASLVKQPGPEQQAAAAPPPPAAASEADADAASQSVVAERAAAAAEVDAKADRLHRGLAALAEVARASGPVPTGEAVTALADKAPAIAAESAPQINAARAEVATLEASLKATDSQIRATDRAAQAASAAEVAPELAFLPGEQRAKPLLIELDDQQTRVGDLDDKGRPRLLATAGAADWSAALDAALAKLRGQDLCVVILTHPGGVGRLGEVRDDVRNRGLDVGWDVTPGRDVFGPKKGADDAKAP